MTRIVENEASVGAQCRDGQVDRDGEPDDAIEWDARYQATRSFSETIASPLTAEDCCVQSMDDASPIRWHLAHTTWFFETFLLKDDPRYTPFDPDFEYLFNSYYNSVGKQFPRSKRGMISRPGVKQTFGYRKHVDGLLLDRISAGELDSRQIEILEIGINHEQQHQELMFTDLKHALSMNPLDPVYLERSTTPSRTAAAKTSVWNRFEEGVVEVGYDGSAFCFDNELPRHRVFLEPYDLAERCVTNGEFREFMEDGGYQRPEFWLSHGWATVCEQQWIEPLYWKHVEGEWTQFTLSGRIGIDWDAPICHLSYFEADAYARWKGCRLPTEFEWEHALSLQAAVGNLAGDRDSWSDRLWERGMAIHPCQENSLGIGVSQSADNSINEHFRAEPALPMQMMGNVWEWTSSHYSAYPGYRAADGALGEYNGKFMCNVFVLRGGSCATPSGHVRPTYRNFFAPDSRWQFSGFRLARS